MKTSITTKVVGALLTMMFVGEALAQVPSSVTQQLRLSTGTASPNYVNHRALTTAGPAPGAFGWYSWDQVPTAVAGTNYLLFLNDQNEVRQTTAFNNAVANFIVTVNGTGTNLTYTDPATLITAQNGLTESPANTIELGGALLHNTSINTAAFNMSFVNNGVGASTFTLGGGTGTLNTTIDPGASGNLNLQNIPADLTGETFLIKTVAGNVRTRDLAGLIDANNGLTETVVAGVSTVSLGSAGPAGSGAPLLSDRFVAMNNQNLNFEGAGNFNLGTGGNMSTNINTGATGNLTLQGTTLNGTANLSNFLYTDGNNVRRATAASIATGTAATYLAVDAGGSIVRAPDPVVGIARGRITGDGNYIYTVTGGLAANVVAGAAVTASVYNTTGAGTISVQVTNVGAGTFTVECAEVVKTGSFINWIAINP